MFVIKSTQVKERVNMADGSKYQLPSAIPSSCLHFMLHLSASVIINKMPRECKLMDGMK
jgi:hypothetical protein